MVKFPAWLGGAELVMPGAYLADIWGRDFDRDEQEDPMTWMGRSPGDTKRRCS